MTNNTAVTPDDFQSAERLSADNLAHYLKGLPVKAQFVLKGMLQLRFGSMKVRLPDKRVIEIKGREPGPDAVVVLHNWNLPQRALMNGTIGVAESYVDGDWESPDVTAFLEFFLINADMGHNFASGATGILRFIERLRHWLNSNTKRKAKDNIAAHYDLGNSFYEQWLDPTMTYSSALYSTGANDLESAQTAKYRALAEAAGIRPGDHVLEIGCGWGGFAEFAASQIGCRVTGLTISREQLRFARERIAKAGLSDRVDLKFQDYRDETGQYDRIISIEMFEAVGEKYWASYFAKIRQCLKQGGKAGLQIITIHPNAYENYRKNPDFIQRYVFPGGMLPTYEHLVGLGRNARLEMTGHHAFGLDYAHTLAQWRERFWRAWDTIAPLGFDERFKRLWEFYLFYCEAGFRGENINVRQVVYE